jgi:Protein of unknown function (DUF1203)
MSFRITGLAPESFQPLFGLPDAELAERGVKRYAVDKKPGFPDRIELRDAEPGESVLLLNYVHQPANTPYRASHAIFVVEGAKQRYDRVDEIPDVMQSRILSLRAFDGDDMIVDADVIDGTKVEGLVERFLGNPKVAYIHAHYAKFGCFAARIERA